MILTRMSRRLPLMLGLSALAFVPLGSAAQAAPTAAAAAPAPLSSLVSAVDIPYQEFRLPNGLRVIVHTDRKAPIVAVSVWYHVGSRFEPAGKTGFAHLFEHLMFYGSENADGPFFGRLEDIGATDWNGTTWFDRTNYFETVPTGALDRALFLESDRMGHLLGAVTQTKLDAQRGVVQNEKRMGENEPYGLVEYAQLAGMLPEGHPYRHSTIGSMADLNAASLADVQSWFKTHYGPNNATLVLAGDIDVPTARAKVEKWFGNIASGPAPQDVDATVPTLDKDVEKVMHDNVAATRLYRNWIVPGVNSPDLQQLDLALSVFGGLGSSRLDNILVRDEKVAVAVKASIQPFEKLSMVEITVDVKPGQDPVAVGKRLDALLADYLAKGPSADEVLRAATQQLSGTIGGLEKVGGFSGKAVTLAEGAVYSNDPGKYKKDLAIYAAATPASVSAAARKWLGRPVFRLTVSPGERSAEDNALAGNAPTGSATMHPAHFRDPNGPAPKAGTPPPPTKVAEPPIEPVKDLVFPPVERAKLSNGMSVVFSRRATVPVVKVSVAFDAGNAADNRQKLGTAALTTALLDEGTTSRNSVQISEEQERLGAGISAANSMDATNVGLYALKPNLDASLGLLADIIRNPAFDPKEVERLRSQMLTRIAAEKTQPMAIAQRMLPPMLYGQAHPYGIPFTGSGTESGVKAVTRADLVAFHDTWMRPDNATIFATGDTTLAELLPLLEKRFGDWKAPAMAKGAKLFRMDRMMRPSRIVLIDKPQSPQSMILAGQLTNKSGTDNPVTLITANEVLGGSTTSRLTMDLREAKGWAYGAGTGMPGVKETIPLLVYAPVQTDKTGESIIAARQDIKDFLTSKGTTQAERDQTINGQILSLPGSFETSSDLLSAMMRNNLLGRPDDYYATLPATYRAITAAQMDQAAREAINPDRLIWVVVGDAKLVKPQLDAVGLPVEMGTLAD
ncbi:M16 family metallopeptidase [Sphingobium yanoikuyae]|uniref:Insulinase family protein n=1 Tax=Sphingobium yanoikuyae TaxID=13690 RepID=A0A085K6R8_SPHYA|nr:pitrilysin family protein [Sphingobium yanoikuyae]AYO79212.1 insulinase family protein [Sphingobium yanoikuyae]KFD28414.1 peptidase M16 [Sphingobium yanoikuyae]KZC77731.1 peptidase M16 [Sphingobium yanoikuyae]MDV3480496.1 pitrilysin family protein [Sphingobium yanoikuyae]